MSIIQSAYNGLELDVSKELANSRFPSPVDSSSYLLGPLKWYCELNTQLITNIIVTIIKTKKSQFILSTVTGLDVGRKNKSEDPKSHTQEMKAKGKEYIPKDMGVRGKSTGSYTSFKRIGMA